MEDIDEIPIEMWWNENKDYWYWEPNIRDTKWCLINEDDRFELRELYHSAISGSV